MNQAEVSKLVSKLRIKVPVQPRKLRSFKGPEGRIDKLRKTVTGLIKYERIELNHNRGDEARQYAERVSITYMLFYSLIHVITLSVNCFLLSIYSLYPKLSALETVTNQQWMLQTTGYWRKSSYINCLKS